MNFRKLSIYGGIAILGIVSIVLGLKIFSFGRIDDWQFTPQNTFEGVIQSILTNAPFAEFWYWYLLVFAIVILLLIPFVLFFHGLFIWLKNRKDKALRARGTHKLALGLPFVLSALAILTTTLTVFAEFRVYDDLGFTILLFILYGLALLSFLSLFIRGLYTWIKYRKTDLIVKKRGRIKTLFIFPYLIIIFVVAYVAAYSSQITTSSLMSSPSYYPQATGSLPGAGMQLYSNVGGSIAETFSAPSFGGAQRDDAIGLAVGGAKDINNFRENIKNGFLPLLTDVTHEGLFYDYFFDTGIQEACTKLFCPSYTSAISKDPFSGHDDYFLSVGLNSGIQQKDFKRKKLNLVVVLDISGSMDSPFDQYYYDRFRDQTSTSINENVEDARKSKMKVATQSLAALLDHLNSDDRFGMVLFDDIAYRAKPLRTVSETDIAKIKDHILDLVPQGGTNMSAGIEEGSKLLEEFVDNNTDEYENRIIFLTDAMPNTGDISETGMLGMTRKNAEKKVYTTFIGIGVDFNTELIEQITKIRGANYYSVHSSAEFKKRMDTQFEYMVTPLVFNLQLRVNAPGFEIMRVYGSPEANEATGEIMKVNTLFPSERKEGQTRGGLVLLHLKKRTSDPQITLTASYEDRSGNTENSIASTSINEDQQEYYMNTGIRKGIALSRYTNALQDWIAHERAAQPQEEPTILDLQSPLQLYAKEGIPVLDQKIVLGQWERQSKQLTVSDEYKKIFDTLQSYLGNESVLLQDASMQKEIDILQLLRNVSSVQ